MEGGYIENEVKKPNGTAWILGVKEREGNFGRVYSMIDSKIRRPILYI